MKIATARFEILAAALDETINLVPEETADQPGAKDPRPVGEFFANTSTAQPASCLKSAWQRWPVGIVQEKRFEDLAVAILHLHECGEQRLINDGT